MKYLIFIDILGFENLARDIASDKGLKTRKVRKDFINTIEERIEYLEENEKIIGKHGKSDDWILVANSPEEAFYSISEILNHDTDYVNSEEIFCELIPLEIAVGTAKYDEWAKFDGRNLIVEDDTIKFLKTYIINHYREWYKKEHDKKIKSTFIIFTKSFHDELGSLDQKNLQKIRYTKKSKDKKEKDDFFFSAEVNEIQERGKVSDFLEKIGYPGNIRFGRINELYIPPLEYDDIKKTLNEKRIVFITGTREFGKTYTAVKLLRDFYDNGYNPKWIKGEEPDDRAEVRTQLQNIRAELKSGSIVYFEDPFGKTKYEKRESLEREIGAIIDTITQFEDSYVIITSREEVFKEFEEETLSGANLKEFEHKLNIKKPSYNYEKRKDILLKWAEEENCKWLENEELKEFILNLIRDKRMLPTPLNMRDFAVATSHVENKDEIIEKIKEKSKETPEAFAEEIENMSNDKIIFLLFPFISRSFEVGFVRNTYQELVEELKLKSAWTFDRVFNWFKDDKININNNKIEFSHSSYHEALEYHLFENENNNITEKILSKILLKLSEKNEAVWDVAQAIAKNYNNLPKNVQNLLFQFCEKNEAALGVAMGVVINYNKLPEEVQSLVFKLSDKDETVFGIIFSVISYYNELPENVQNLVFKFSEKDEIIYGIVLGISFNYNKLPEEVQNLLFELSENENMAYDVARAIAKNYNNLPKNVQEIFFKLYENENTRGDIISVIAENYNSLPENVQNLLFKLSKKNETLWDIGKAITENYNSLPENVQEIVFKFSENDVSAVGITVGIVSKYNELPEEVQNLLFKLYKNESCAYSIAFATAYNYNKLPEEVQNLLFELSENENMAYDVARAIAQNYNYLPKNIMNELLRKLFIEYGNALNFAEIFKDNLDIMSELT